LIVVASLETVLIAVSTVVFSLKSTKDVAEMELITLVIRSFVFKD